MLFMSLYITKKKPLCKDKNAQRYFFLWSFSRVKMYFYCILRSKKTKKLLVNYNNLLTLGVYR